MNKDWYAKNKNATYQRNKRTRARLQEWYRSLKDHKPCTDCGKTYPHYQMDWDHLPQFEKRAEVIRILRDTSNKNAVLEEIAKCELVCALCHRERTFQRNRCGVEELVDSSGSDPELL